MRIVPILTYGITFEIDLLSIVSFRPGNLNNRFNSHRISTNTKDRALVLFRGFATGSGSRHLISSATPELMMGYTVWPVFFSRTVHIAVQVI